MTVASAHRVYQAHSLESPRSRLSPGPPALSPSTSLHSGAHCPSTHHIFFHTDHCSSTMACLLTLPPAFTLQPEWICKPKVHPLRSLLNPFQSLTLQLEDNPDCPPLGLTSWAPLSPTHLRPLSRPGSQPELGPLPPKAVPSLLGTVLSAWTLLFGHGSRLLFPPGFLGRRPSW